MSWWEWVLFGLITIANVLLYFSNRHLEKSWKRIRDGAFDLRTEYLALREETNTTRDECKALLERIAGLQDDKIESFIQQWSKDNLE